MSLSAEETTGFWGMFSRSARASRQANCRPIEPAPAMESGPIEAVRPRPWNALSKRAASEAQHKRRALLEAEKFAVTHLAAIRKGDYAYRVLKDEFDEACEEAGIDAVVSDKRFAAWLQASGGRKYRAHRECHVYYRIPARMNTDRLPVAGLKKAA